jgi:hypothetical protein
VQGWTDPCASFLVKIALKGASRDTGAPDVRLPITPVLLKKLIAALPMICSSPYEMILFKCVFVLAFFGLFRISELVCQNKKDPSSKVLQISDIAFKEEKMKVTIRFSKTDQKGKSSPIVFKSKKGENLCPVQSMKKYITERGHHDGPLFCHADGSYLSRFQFNKVLERTVGFLDNTISNIKSHSFRIGGATNAICKGIPYEQVQEMGRWQSDAAKRYIRVPTIDVATLI